MERFSVWVNHNRRLAKVFFQAPVLGRLFGYMPIFRSNPLTYIT